MQELADRSALEDFADVVPGVPRNLGELIVASAERWGPRVAWRFGDGQTLTFGDVDRITRRVAMALKESGVKPGDRVGLLARNTITFPATWLAIARLGAATVPINVNYRLSDASHVVEHADIAVLVVVDEFQGLAREIVARAPQPVILLSWEELLAHPEPVPGVLPVGLDEVKGEATCNIQYTSGTTGLPKGCVLGQDYWLAIAWTLHEQFPQLNENDVMLTAQPFHYIDPQWNVVSALYAGSELVILDKFHPSTFWRDVCRFGVTYLYCLGVMPTLMMKMPTDPAERDHKVRAIQCSAIPVDLHPDLEERWGVPWYEAFGMTETGADLFVDPGEHDELIGSGCLGRPRAHRDALVVDEEGAPVSAGTIGQLLIRGSGLMKEYFRNAEATEAALWRGWFRTGDLATVDGSGRIYYRGRTKDMIRRSGENISAAELEQLLQRHPEVEMAAVVAVPDDLRGEEVLAYVVPADPVAPPATLMQELARWSAEEVAYFKVPRYWRVVPEIPRTPSERIAKSRLDHTTDSAWDSRARRSL